MTTFTRTLWYRINKIGSWIIPSWKRHSLVGPPSLWKTKRDFQINFLKGQGLEPGDNLLDIGCGTLRGGVPLISYLEPGKYVGIDVRDVAIKESRKELKKSKLTDKKATLVCFSEFSELDLGRQFDVIWSFSVVIHMTDEIVDALMEFIFRHLADNGKFFANINMGETRNDKDWEGFPHNYRPLAFYENLAEKNGLSVKNIGPLKEYGHNIGFPVQDDQQMLIFTKK